MEQTLVEVVRVGVTEVSASCITGRAVVELTVEKQDGSLAYVTNEGGGPQKEVLPVGSASNTCFVKCRCPHVLQEWTS